MRSARLLGREHLLLGALSARADDDAAIAISRGGAAKRYDHTEPNEDVACFARGDGGSFVAVADGHHGAAGAEAAIDWLATEVAPGWLAASLPFSFGPAPTRSTASDAAAWRSAVLAALAGANHAVLADAARRGLPPAPTTLALALVRPAERRLAWAAVGDSHVFAVGAAEARDVAAEAFGERRPSFLGYEALTAAGMAEHCASGELALDGLRALLLATDGLSEREIGVDDPAGAVARAADGAASFARPQRALELVRALTETALAEHRRRRSGDNVACAAVWLGRDGRAR